MFYFSKFLKKGEKMIKIIASRDAKNLQQELEKHPNTATVEAEFGKKIVKGSLYTLAHHDERQWAICPCLIQNISGSPEDLVIGISHFDLDTLGGIMGLIGEKRHLPNQFWEAAAYSDIHGPHRIHEYKFYQEVKHLINAFYAWSEKNRIDIPFNGDVVDCTDLLINAIKFIKKLVNNKNNQLLLKEGADWEKKMYSLNKDTFVEVFHKNGKDIIVRENLKNGSFVNGLYKDPAGVVRDVIVSYTEIYGRVTISSEKEFDDIDCKEIMQSYFGEKAGGKKVIAGSPRDKKINYNEFKKFVEYLKNN